MVKKVSLLLAVVMLLGAVTILAEKTPQEIDREVNLAMRQLAKPNSVLISMFEEDLVKPMGSDWGAPDDGAGTRYESAVITLRGHVSSVPSTYYFDDGTYSGNLSYQYKNFVEINGNPYTLVKYYGSVTKK